MNTFAPIAIGNQTAAAAPDFLDPFEFALTSGFDAFEWFPDKQPSGAGWDESDLTSVLRAQVRRSARAHRVSLSVHARWTASALEPEGYAVLLKDLELAEALGATLLNLHLYTGAGMAAFAQALLPLVQCATDAGLRIAIENTPETTPLHFNELFATLKAMDPPGLRTIGMCLDIGHANLCADTRNNYLAYMDQLAPHVPIIHLHVHENWGDTDSHLPLFTGPAASDTGGVLGFLKRLRQRRYSGSIILEQWPNPPTLLIDARDRLLHMLGSLEGPPCALPAPATTMELHPRL